MDFSENNFGRYYVFIILFNKYYSVIFIIGIVRALIINILFKFRIES